MKKINSIGYGPKVLLAGGVLLVPVHALFYGLSSLFSIAQLRTAALLSFGAGGPVLLFFTCLLAVEFRQDARINKRYATLRRTKVRTATGHYECQACGCLTLAEKDTACPVCGIHFLEN